MIQYPGEQVSELISAGSLSRRVRELGEQVTADYQGKDLHLVGVLKGAVPFLVDLARAIRLPVSIDFMGVSSYGASTESSGIVRITKDLDETIEGRNVLIVEDIIDSGLTLQYLLDTLRRRQPASLRVCALLNKAVPGKAVRDVDYVGFEIPDAFAIGYGLDYAERYRNLPFIGVLSLDEAQARDGADR